MAIAWPTEAKVMTDRFCVAASQFLGRNDSSGGSLLQLSAARRQMFVCGFGPQTRCLSPTFLETHSEDMQGLSLAPELLVQCDGTNHGCGGGRLDDVWLFLRSHGVPQAGAQQVQSCREYHDYPLSLKFGEVEESCAPYEHCRVPTQRSCDYDWEPRHAASRCF